MTSKEYLKLELMVFAISHDFFGYGSTCKKRSDGRWVSIVDGERFVDSGKSLAAQWDTLDEKEKSDILAYYSKKELNVSIDLHSIL